MPAPRVYIDGQSGTIGLRIRELLRGRSDLQILEIEASQRRNPEARRRMLDGADVAILCLPDEAAREAVALAENPALRIIDGSTAHRTSAGWVYGLPELSREQRQEIRAARRVANPGCWPTGVALLLRPLRDAGLLPAHAPITVHGLSGYSGGGKTMIADWEASEGGLSDLPFEAPYGFDKRHKHIPEMMRYANLTVPPHFVPAVGAFRCGMRVQIPLHQASIPDVDPGHMVEALRARYADEPFITVLDHRDVLPSTPATFDPRRCNGSNRVELAVLPHPDGHVLLLATLDNLGKGASGAAVQSLNLMLGIPEDAGL